MINGGLFGATVMGFPFLKCAGKQVVDTLIDGLGVLLRGLQHSIDQALAFRVGDESVELGIELSALDFRNAGNDGFNDSFDLLQEFLGG